MDFTAFLQRDYHKVMSVFGKRDWVNYLYSEEKKSVLVTTGAPKFSPQDGLTLDEWQFGNSIIKTISNDRILLSWFYILSKSLAYGPKVFYPTLEQCESMAQIDVELSVSDYTQPYPTIIFQFPKEFATAIQEQFKIPWRPTAAIVHVDSSGFVLAGINMSNDDRIVSVIPPTQNTFEEYIGKKMKNPSGQIIEDAEMEACHLIERVCLNCGMLLMQHKIKKAPIDKIQYEKHRRKHDDRNKLFRLADMEQISFEQNIIVREVRESAPGVHGEGHRSPVAHWRRGHWRMQAHGPSRSLRRPVLIKPIFVNSQSFIGDLSQTSVSIKKE